MKKPVIPPQKTKRIAVCGSWFGDTEKARLVAQDVRCAVRGALDDGHCIVGNGGLGVSYVATEEALLYRPNGSRARVLIPTTLAIHEAHHRDRVALSPLAKEEVPLLLEQLTRLHGLGCVEEKNHGEPGPACRKAHAHDLVHDCDEVWLFYAEHRSDVTRHMLRMAEEAGKNLKIWPYGYMPPLPQIAAA